MAYFSLKLMRSFIDEAIAHARNTRRIDGAISGPTARASEA
jgi:hypothetical protein